MDNINHFPARVFRMGRIALRDAAAVYTENNITCVHVCGSARGISSFSDYGSTVPGTVQATSLKHTFLTGDYVTIWGSSVAAYNGTFQVTRINGVAFYFSAAWSATSTASCTDAGVLRSIAGFSHSGGTITATCPSHRYQTGDEIEILGPTTATYKGVHVITRIDDDTFSFAGSDAGTRDAFCKYNAAEHIPVSPLDGLPAIKCIGRAGGNSVWTFEFTEAQVIYPNVGIVLRTLGSVDAGDGSLDTSTASINRPPVLLVSEEETPANARLSANRYRFPHDLRNGRSDKWRVMTQARRSFDGTASGTLKEWCTTHANQGFSTNHVSFEQPSDASAPQVFLLGGVVTENALKARLIIGFDSWHAEAHANCFAEMKSRGWRGQLFLWAERSVDSYEPGIEARVQEAYDAGWDVSNHTLRHNTKRNSLSQVDSRENDLVNELLAAKAWQLSKGWARGADFIGYAGTAIQLATKNGADIADQYFVMGRGQGYRSQFYLESHGFTAGYSQVLPNDMLNISHVAASGGDNDDYAASDVKSSLAETVLHRGVLNIYLHNVLESPAAIQNSINWWNGFVEDVAARVAAGELEVITMTDWYNELYGIERHSALSLPDITSAVSAAIMEVPGRKIKVSEAGQVEPDAAGIREAVGLDDADLAAHLESVATALGNLVHPKNIHAMTEIIKAGQ